MPTYRPLVHLNGAIAELPLDGQLPGTVTGVMPVVTGAATITAQGAYDIITFTGNGTLTFGRDCVIEKVLLVGGGGGGGSRHGGGGGGGAVVEKSAHAVTGGIVRSISVGVGGIGSSSSTPIGTNGGDTSFDNMVALGGGRSGGYQYGGGGNSGGSGGGGVGWTGITTGGFVSSYQGNGSTSYAFQGGNGLVSGDYGGGGGGGAGGAGSNAYDYGGQPAGGAGGPGRASNITGTVKYYGPGGGGCSAFLVTTPKPEGGLGGGGSGDYTNGVGVQHPPTAGAANSGGGGGGSRNSFSGGNGGSGVAIFKVLRAQEAPVSTASPWSKIVVQVPFPSRFTAIVNVPYPGMTPTTMVAALLNAFTDSENDAEEVAEMSVIAVPGTDSFNLHFSAPGYFGGPFNILYMVQL